MLKLCRDCKREKLEEEFYKKHVYKGKVYRESICIECKKIKRNKNSLRSVHKNQQQIKELIEEKESLCELLTTNEFQEIVNVFMILVDWRDGKAKNIIH